MSCPSSLRVPQLPAHAGLCEGTALAPGTQFPQQDKLPVHVKCARAAIQSLPPVYS